MDMRESADMRELSGGQSAPQKVSELNAMSADAAIAALQFILKFEADARSTASVEELGFLAVNNGRRLANARQVFFLQSVGNGALRTMAISSLAAVDRNAPLVLWIERMALRISREHRTARPQPFSLPAYCDAKDAETKSYPFREMLWLPLMDRRGNMIAALLLASEQPWFADQLAPVERMGEICSHALQFHTGRGHLKVLDRFRNRWLMLVILCGVGLLACPVRMSALAPAEVVARAPTIVAAPVDGVISDILVDPSTPVRTGDILIRFNDTQVRAAAAVAEQEFRVAEAKLREAQQGAFVDQTYNRGVAIAEAELAIKQSERDYALQVLDNMTVKADRPGLVLFADKRELIGRPVSIGQRIMEIADPRDVALRVLLSVEDAALLDQNGTVRMFLDSDPLHPVKGSVTRTSFIARMNEGNQLSFRVDAAPDAAGSALRLGLRGTAQVIGSYVPLGYFLFRKPLTYLRQRLGA